MRKTSLLLVIATLVLQNSGGSAASLGAQKWAETPQLFDGHAAILYALTVTLLALTFVLKPAGMQFSEIYKTHWKGAPQIAFLATRLSFFAFVSVIFLNLVFSRT